MLPVAWRSLATGSFPAPVRSEAGKHPQTAVLALHSGRVTPCGVIAEVDRTRFSGRPGG